MNQHVHFEQHEPSPQKVRCNATTPVPDNIFHPQMIKLQKVRYRKGMKPILLIATTITLSSSAWAACDHPYFPSAANTTWQYQSSMKNTEHTTKIISNSGSSFVMENNFGSLVVKNTIKCESDGSLTQTEYPSMSGLSANMKIETISYEGAAFPAPAKWVVGSSWTNSFKVKISVAMGQQTMTQSGMMKISSKIAAEETVKVPAGTFTALKVTQTIAQDMQMTIAGKSTPVKNTISTTTWYAKNVGVVKSIASSITTQLLKFTKP
jgi:hypothetical protein